MNKAKIRARLEEVNRRLQLYYEAETAILAGAQSYQIGSRNITRATLATVRDEIGVLENKKAELENMLSGAGRRATFRVIPRDL
ncbi:DUF6148 family protein [Paenibacillus phocaensis]|jgi:hypothetical protein|uniref:DUF6148 family protein n=1 Tax=Paenibacillus phocaensis TaxID=1776378 RepID=UPI000839C1FE|nr:DUF6148 family protein [Paenibacillus phocaensis]